MLSRLKSRPEILVALGIFWIAAVMIVVRTWPGSFLAGDFGQGLGMGIGLGLEILGWMLLLRAKRRRDRLRGESPPAA